MAGIKPSVKKNIYSSFPPKILDRKQNMALALYFRVKLVSEVKLETLAEMVLV